MTALEAVPVASIVVPSYGGAARLPALLDSLAAQVDAPPFEVIVVVDGDDDGSVELVEARSRAGAPFTARAILLPENRGRVTALNTGFDAARGDVLIRCDDDLLPGADYVRGHVACHAGEDCGVVGLYRNLYDATPYAEAYGRDADEKFRQGAYRTALPMRWRYWAGNCSITRSVWERIGPYDPTYRLYGWEDVDYGYRLHQAGIPVALVPELETGHRVAAVTTAVRARRAVHAGAARRIFEAKHGTDVLPSAVPPLSMWNALVRVLAPATARRSWQVGRAVDRVIPFVPRGLARKLVALVVESAGVGGYRSPGDVTEVF